MAILSHEDDDAMVVASFDVIIWYFIINPNPSSGEIE